MAHHPPTDRAQPTTDRALGCIEPGLPNRGNPIDGNNGTVNGHKGTVGGCFSTLGGCLGTLAALARGDDSNPARTPNSHPPRKPDAVTAVTIVQYDRRYRNARTRPTTPGAAQRHREPGNTHDPHN